jgi:opacity protein-like surface antigen
MLQKTKVLTLILFGLLFLNLSAQEGDFENDPIAKLPDENRSFRFGLQFSPNISWLKANTAGYESNGSKIGFNYGLSAEFFLTKNYLFSTGVSILNSGGNLTYTGTSYRYFSTKVNEKLKLKYIEIPFLLKLKTNEIGYLSYFAQIGLKGGFNFKAKTSYTYSNTGTNGFTIVPTNGSTLNEDDEFDAEINWINLYLVIGAGVEYNISGNTSLMLGITFNNGFINQLDSKAHLLDDNGSVLFDDFGNPIYSEKDANANLNYIALNIGIYF